MSDTTDTTSSPATDQPSSGPKKGLNSMLLPELRRLGGSLGIKTAGLRKGDLVEAIKAAQGGGNGAAKQADRAPSTPEDRAGSQGGDKGSDQGSDKGSGPGRRQVR